MSTTPSESTHEYDRDVVVVGGGPAGCSAGVFTARHGLDTVVYDRGRSSLKQCAYLENYLGFPAGIDVETFFELIHDHAERAGCELVPDVVESVDRTEDGSGLRVSPQERGAVTARRVVAATRYDGEYLRGLDDESAMFETREYDGDSHERFDREYADADGTTPVDGLYVASPSPAADRQAVVAAGRGARVGLAVVEAVRRDRGLPAGFGRYRDWVRREAERDEEWSDRERWREWFDDRLPADREVVEGQRLSALREREIDRLLASYRSDAAIDEAAERGQRRLLDRVDDDLVLERAREIAAETGEVED